MNHFPFMAPVEQTIINAIQNLNKSTFSGAMPFVFFTAHSEKDPITIGTETSYKYGSKEMGKHRFPPLITNLEVKPTGTMGVVREGEVTVKFASMEQLKENQNFFRIGNAKTITWGWNQNRLNGTNFNLGKDQTPSDTFSKGIANNIDNWRTQLKAWNYSADILVGPLINFSFTLNNDASVDVVFTVGSPNELVAFMGSHKKDLNEVKSSDADNIVAYRVASLLNLIDGDFSPAIFKDIRPNLLNYDNTQSTLKKIWEGVTSLINTIMGDSQYDNVSEDVYVSFDAITKFALNQNPPDTTIKSGYIFDISEAISVAHPHMISNSENVIFLNKEMANPTIVNNKIILDKTKFQTFDTIINEKSHSYPQSDSFDGKYGGTENKFKPFHWGYIKNVFFKVPFVQDIIKNNGDGSIVDIVEKLCNEINIASCGLTDLAPQTSCKKNGKEVFTIVDYALIPDTDKIKPTPLSLFEKGSNSSTIINISFNCDLPKEIGAMAMLGNRKSTDVGGKLFFDYKPDNVLMTPDRLSDYNYTGAKGNGGGGGGGNSNNYGKIKPGSYNPGDTDSNGNNVGNPGSVAPIGKVWSFQYGAGELIPIDDTTKGQWYLQTDPNLTPEGELKNKIAGKMLIDESCVFIKYDTNEHTPSKNLDHGVFKAVFKNTDMIKAMYFSDPNHNKNNPLLPIELEITVLGISGIIAGQIIELEKDALPFGNVGIFQVKEVNHTVDDKWETTIKLGFRPKN